MSDPNDKPGYIVVDLLSAASVSAAEDAGYTIDKDVNPNVVSAPPFLWAVMSRGYKK